MVKSDVLFSKSTGKSSDISTDDPSETSKDNLLVELRSKVLGTNLFEVKELLHKLSKLPSGSRFQEFSQTLEPLMDGIHQSFQQKKTDQSKLEEQTLRCDQLRAEAATFQANPATFWQEILDTQQKVAEIDSPIAKYKEEIQILELQKATVLEKQALMKKEASISIQKVKESKVFQQEIATLVDNGKALDEKLTGFKSQLDKLKSEFVI